MRAHFGLTRVLLVPSCAFSRAPATPRPKAENEDIKSMVFIQPPDGMNETKSVQSFGLADPAEESKVTSSQNSTAAKELQAAIQAGTMMLESAVNVGALFEKVERVRHGTLR